MGTCAGTLKWAEPSRLDAGESPDFLRSVRRAARHDRELETECAAAHVGELALLQFLHHGDLHDLSGFAIRLQTFVDVLDQHRRPWAIA